ncbi:MAG: PQQ-dependent sugar dehydrogenase [Rhodanobacteraceae bacterium]|nr:PQQ-dependent sugar dehydrogenase [Rhodanobacteraceae bacterium]
MIRRSLTAALVLASAPAFAQTLPPDLALTDICPACTAFDRPLIVRHAGDGSGRLFVVEQIGNIRIFVNGAYLTTPFLTFVGPGNAPPGGFVAVGGTGDERGLLGLAFHPDFAQNGYLYINYNDSSGDTVVARYTVSQSNPNVVDTATRLVILRVDQDFSNHNGGNILFGPDGYLYIGMGDGGSGNDPCNRAQSLTPADLVPNEGTSGCPADSAFVNSGGNADSRTLLGKMLRLNVDTTTAAGANELCASNADGSANYAIPGDNPFLGTARLTGACDEVLDYGLRNPWRFSFDRETGALFIGDVGQSAQEEISYRPAGPIGAPINFGWDCREGTGSAGGTCRVGDTLTGPILAYGRSAGFAVTGGYRIRGTIPLLNGLYVYADYGSRNVWFAEETAPGTFGPQPTTANRWGQAPSGVASFGEDEDGRIYVAAFNGKIYRFTSNTELPPVLFANGFE